MFRVARAAAGFDLAMLSCNNISSIRVITNLKDVLMRFKSVKYIQKITKSMKMIAAVKYARAKKELKQARPFGEGAKTFCKRLEITGEQHRKPDHLMVVMSSDRGLCGAIHSNLSKAVRHDMQLDINKNANVNMILCGEKLKGKQFDQQILMHVTEIGKKTLTFQVASFLAEQIFSCGFNFNQGDIYFNKFKSVVSYSAQRLPIFSLNSIAEHRKLSIYDSLDANVSQSYLEYSLASLLCYAMKEGATSEQSSRTTAMESASKNAVRLRFNMKTSPVILNIVRNFSSWHLMSEVETEIEKITSIDEAKRKLRELMIVCENSNAMVQCLKESMKTANEGMKTANEGVKTANESVKTANEGVKSANEGVKTANELVKMANELKQSEIKILQLECQIKDQLLRQVMAELLLKMKKLDLRGLIEYYQDLYYQRLSLAKKKALKDVGRMSTWSEIWTSIPCDEIERKMTRVQFALQIPIENEYKSADWLSLKIVEIYGFMSTELHRPQLGIKHVDLDLFEDRTDLVFVAALFCELIPLPYCYHGLSSQV